MIAEVALQALNNELQGGMQPYPGLRPFEREESHYFKGREAQIEEIIQRLASDSCVVILGGSGCGKSSIVRAGVIPALQLKMLPGRGDFWRVAICSPGNKPVTHLVEALDRLLVPDCSGERRKKILDVLYGSDGLGGFLPTFKEEIPLGLDLSKTILDKANLLVLVDQFEELFREENRGQPETTALAELIIDAWQSRNRYTGLYLVLTMRTDDLHRCAEFIDLPEVINAAGYLTRRLQETELRQAIVEPLRPTMFRAGILQEVYSFGVVDVRPYDVQVVTELLDAVKEIAHDPDHLPLLQHLLAILWRTTLERWKREAAVRPEEAKPQITLQDLARALGFESWDEVVRARAVAYCAGVSGWLLRRCLEYVAEQLYAGSIYAKQLTDHQQNIARVAFCLMGAVDDHGNFKRRWTNKKEIARVAGLEKPDADVEAVIGRFHKDHRLLLVRPNGQLDVSHESLMRNWPRLGKLLEEDRDASTAYRDLVDRYERWQQRRQSQFWPSWLTQWFGLLPAHELEHVKRLDAPCYNRYWSERVISDSNQDQDAGATGTQRNKELLRNRSVFLARRQYLRRSIWRNSMAQGMKYILVIAVMVVIGLVWRMHYQTQTAKLQAETAFMWGTFSDWNPVMTHREVESLWKLATRTHEYRSVFVDQIGRIGSITDIGFRPQPVLRAVGLCWPEQKQRVGVKAMLEIADKSQSEWDLAALACVVETLDDRIDETSKAQALKVLSKYVDDLSTPQDISPRKLWPFTRIIACVGDKLDGKVRDKAIQAMEKAIENAARPSSSFDTGIANSIAIIASYLEAHPSVKPVTSEALKKARSGAITDMIQKLSRDPSGSTAQFMARPLASLLAALSHQEQREVLDQLLSFVTTNKVEEDLLLRLAQTVEIIAERRVFADGNQLEAWLTEDQNSQKFLALERPSNDTISPLAVARLIAPLAEHPPMSTNVVDKLLRIAGVEGSATNLAAATNALLQEVQQTAGSMPEEFRDKREAQFAVLRLGLCGRLLATLVTQKHAGEAGSTAGVIEEAIEKAKPRLPSISFAFAREGLARALTALAPNLQDTEREQALKSAHERLAMTGSAAEAAAWSRAIAELLKKERDEYKFVNQIVAVLKYPTAALIDREPGVSEPRSATDILVEALRWRLSHLELPDGKGRWDGGLHPVLDKIEQDQRFRDISLTTPVVDPRPKLGQSPTVK